MAVSAVDERPSGPETVGAATVVDDLLDLPRSERRQALEDLVVAEFKIVLLMDDGDELPLDESYFDLGLTSLTITDLKQSLESMIGHELSASLLFNSPTVGQLMDHICEELLPGLFRPASVSAPANGPASAAASRSADHSADALVDEALKNLYQG
ncbi:acyl carrier protein [Streptomyces sp. BE133]|uniref:acyl carrier protein n=1 Tax=Streptomyces sp. BE133 TaxID=3002523 RepID=UPI002E75A1B0|nr:acyl carrier protein [Streptomyces sp. BE133]MEE1811435.1 acyl carrier protein [Streptomyces sp. BE133]